MQVPDFPGVFADGLTDGPRAAIRDDMTHSAVQPSALALGSAACDDRVAMSVEHELVREALAGNGRAFASLVGPHLAVLYRIAARACQNHHLAEDAVQETLATAYAKLGRYEPGTSLRAFLAAIAVRQAQTLLRGERRRKAREDRTACPENVPQPADLVSAARTMERIRHALVRMPKKRREVALLRLDGNLSYTEIAQAVGTTEGSARVLVHLALKELKDALSDLFVDG
jgi:RNA polymerase sigma-70 factor (ECF subfamily)